MRAGESGMGRMTAVTLPEGAGKVGCLYTPNLELAVNASDGAASMICVCVCVYFFIKFHEMNYSLLSSILVFVLYSHIFYSSSRNFILIESSR